MDIEKAVLPSLTVVIPSYNKGRTIGQTLESILDHNQGEGLEVIVLDAESNDETREALRKWEGRCKMIIEKDRGQSDAIDKGFRRASSDLVCWLNADDLFFPGACDRVRRLFAENPDYDVISGRGVHLNLDGSFRMIFPEGPDFDEKSLRKMRVCVLQPSVFFRRCRLQALGGINSRLQYVMDWDLWCRFIKSQTTWLTVNDYFSAARIYRDTKTASGGLLRFWEHWRIAKNHTGKIFPSPTLGLLLSWGLEDAPKLVSPVFQWVFKLKSLLQFKEVRPSIHQPQWSKGLIDIQFPWFYGKTKEVRCDLEIKCPDARVSDVEVAITCNGIQKTFQTGEGFHSFRIPGPFDDVLFKILIDVSSPHLSRVLTVSPGLLSLKEQ